MARKNIQSATNGNSTAEAKNAMHGNCRSKEFATLPSPFANEPQNSHKMPYAPARIRMRLELGQETPLELMRRMILRRGHKSIKMFDFAHHPSSQELADECYTKFSDLPVCPLPVAHRGTAADSLSPPERGGGGGAGD